MKNKIIQILSILMVLAVSFLPITNVYAFDFKGAISKGLEAGTKGLDSASKGLKKANEKHSKSETADKVNKKLNSTSSDVKNKGKLEKKKK